LISDDGVSSVGGGTNGSHLDTTDTSSVLDTDLNVSAVSPGRTPRVLDEVVVLAVLSSPSNSKDTVIEVGSTSRAGKNTSLVHLEGSLVSFDSNGSRSFLNGGLEGGGAPLLDIGVALSPNVSGSLALASSLFSSVGIVRLKNGRGSFEEDEGELHGTTIASVVSLGAVNELLLGERQKLSRGVEVSSFHSTSGGERPA